MEIDALSFERLAPEQKFTSFDCGDEDLNDFLLTDAQNYQKSLLAVTYLVKDSDDVIGYFSLLNDADYGFCEVFVHRPKSYWVCLHNC